MPMAQEPSRGNDLFSPSLQTPGVGYNERPWKLSSQFWVAFLGGTLAIAGLSYFNAKRLKVPADKLRLIVLIGVIGTIATIGMALYVGTNYEALATSANSRQLLRFSSRIAALLTYYLMRRIQEPYDRRFGMFYGGDGYDSLWKAGLAATFGLGIIQTIIIVVISLATSGSVGVL
jgi:hypothetical protein